MTRRFTISLPDGTANAIEQFCEEYSLARSRVISDIVERYLIEDDKRVSEVVPEATVELARKERREKEMLDRQKIREKKHSFEDRIRGHFRKRLEGDAAYSPEGMRDLALGYKEDAEIWHDDPREADRKKAKVDRWLEIYEAGYFARKHADKVDTEVNPEDVSGWFEVGEGMHRLRENLPEVVDHIRTVADSSAGWDSEAVIDSVAKRWTVSPGAAHLLIESLTVESADIQETLSLGGDRLKTPEDIRLSAGGPEPEPEPLPEGAEGATVDTTEHSHKVRDTAVQQATVTISEDNDD